MKPGNRRIMCGAKSCRSIFLRDKEGDVCLCFQGPSLRRGTFLFYLSGFEFNWFRKGDVPGLTSQISQDDYDLALLSLEKMAQDINGSGNIVVIWVGGYAPMEKRMKILKVMESEYPNIHVVSQFGNATNTTISDTMSCMEAVLRAHSTDIKAVWASWDQFALGAEQAIQTLNSNVPVYSIDLSTQDVATMRKPNSTWVASAGTDVYEYGTVAMRYAVSAAYNQTVPRYYLMPGALMTRGNLPSSGSMHDWFSTTYPEQGKIGLTPGLQSLLSK